MNCSECGGRCCKMMVMPPMTTASALRTVGVEIQPGKLMYAALHRGVTVRGGRLYLDEGTPLVAYNGRLGRTMIAFAPCAWLEHGQCAHYEDRPAACREFNRETAERYLVPNGCWCDTGGLGEDFSEVIGHGKADD